MTSKVVSAKIFALDLLMIRHGEVSRNVPSKKLSHRCNRHAAWCDSAMDSMKNQLPFRFLTYRQDHISLEKFWLSNLQRIAASLPTNQPAGFTFAIRIVQRCSNANGEAHDAA